MRRESLPQFVPGDGVTVDDQREWAERFDLFDAADDLVGVAGVLVVVDLPLPESVRVR
jgi:hypothetical protein